MKRNEYERTKREYKVKVDYYENIIKNAEKTIKSHKPYKEKYEMKLKELESMEDHVDED